MSALPDREWFTERWTTTALRTVGLAIVIGLMVCLANRTFRLLPIVVAMALWFTLGGHFVELVFRNDLARHIGHRGALAASRIAYWFVAGSLLFAGALLTWRLVNHAALRWPWWVGGVGFVAAELLVHLGLRARGHPSFYDSRG